MGASRVAGAGEHRTAQARASWPGEERSPAHASEYGFLLNGCLDEATLARAIAIAERTGVYPHDVLIAQGWVKAETYYRALAKELGVPFEPRPNGARVQAPAPAASPRDCLAKGLVRERSRTQRLLFAPDRLRPVTLREVLARLRPRDVALAPPQAVRRAIYHHFRDSFAHDAIEALAERHPERSARSPLARWQRWTLAPCAGVLLAALLAAPVTTITAVTLTLAVAFVPIIGLRIVAAAGLLRASSVPQRESCARLSDAELPLYTLFVPLLREANVLPALVQTLSRLDYPAAKLDIKLILESADGDTIAAARALDLPGNFEIVIVPDLVPRTKPKAMNYALPLARGEYLAIYDAEDRPERDQLRRAVHAFRQGPPNLAVVQARLNIYNIADNWLTRQFTIEYSASFDGVLPSLERLGLPIPLGGTSNHFRVSALKWLMAWDPFNVTEDADLGIRLNRNGYRYGIISSTTHEEAPSKLMGWLKQRTRWLKGYLLTWLVHIREPRTLWRELGPRGFAGFQLVIGGTVLSALVHPWFYVLSVFEIAHGGFLSAPASLLGVPFWVIAWSDLLSGYLAAMAVGFLSVRNRGYRDLFAHVLLTPLYWLLISVAAYAIWQFGSARYTWEKTEHGQASQRNAAA